MNRYEDVRIRLSGAVPTHASETRLPDLDSQLSTLSAHKPYDYETPSYNPGSEADAESKEPTRKPKSFMYDDDHNIPGLKELRSTFKTTQDRKRKRAIHSTISRDNTSGDDATRATRLADFGQRLSSHAWQTPLKHPANMSQQRQKFVRRVDDMRSRVRIVGRPRASRSRRDSFDKHKVAHGKSKDEGTHKFGVYRPELDAFASKMSDGMRFAAAHTDKSEHKSRQWEASVATPTPAAATSFAPPPTPPIPGSNRSRNIPRDDVVIPRPDYEEYQPKSWDYEYWKMPATLGRRQTLNSTGGAQDGYDYRRRASDMVDDFFEYVKKRSGGKYG